MQVVVNGNPREVPDALTGKALVAHLGLAPDPPGRGAMLRSHPHGGNLSLGSINRGRRGLRGRQIL